jgi:two-component system phosphate regulon sensor histidine kinase PhoR
MRLWRDRVRMLEEQVTAAEAVIAAAPDPLILLDERRRIVRANPQATAFVGTLSEPRDLATALRNPAVLAAADAVLNGEAARIADFTITAPIERQLRARLARIDHPAPDGAVAVLALHDITQLKRAEQMRADFIANASHELRTPLATLTGFIETLRGPARDDAEARERFLAIMHQQASRMTRLVEDLLSLSRIELNEHMMPRDYVELDPLLRHVAESLELRAAEREMRIQFALPAELPPVIGDRDELAQVFQNLIDNAIKYGRPNSTVRVAVGRSNRALPGGGERRRGGGGQHHESEDGRGSQEPRAHLRRCRRCVGARCRLSHGTRSVCVPRVRRVNRAATPRCPSRRQPPAKPSVL